jgi:aspartyl-tRNA(Asn)/glutamyl-tRNA(Gln) amidotransferase subunit A
MMKSFAEIRAAYGAKKLSPTELTSQYLDAIQASTHNAFITVCKDRALAQAKTAEKELFREGVAAFDKKPLLGIPIAAKDNMVIDGVRTTCASRMLENYIPPYTATAIERLEQAGAIIVGKTNLDEFAMGSSNENSAFGPVKNPVDPTRVAGGSSGGSATGVRAGLCAASLGSDTGGSIRLPASFCGVVGLKPTYGRVSRYGLVAFASSLDQIGPFASTVQDSASVLQSMWGSDPLDSTSSSQATPDLIKAVSQEPSWSSLRVGVPREYFEAEALSGDVRKSIEASVKWFEKKGAKIVPISLSNSKYAVAVYYVVALCEASSNLSRFDGVRFGFRPKEADEAADIGSFYEISRSAFGAEVKRRIILGTFALSSGFQDDFYVKACRVRRLIKRDFDQAFEKVDLIAGPVSTTTAFKIGEKSSDPLAMYLNDIYTIPANLAGIPAISLPCAVGGDGMPIGLHLQAAHFREDLLLSVSAAFEKEHRL